MPGSGRSLGSLMQPSSRHSSEQFCNTLLSLLAICTDIDGELVVAVDYGKKHDEFGALGYSRLQLGNTAIAQSH